MAKIDIDHQSYDLHFALCVNHVEVVAMGFFTRSKIKVRSAAATLKLNNRLYMPVSYNSDRGYLRRATLNNGTFIQPYHGIVSVQRMGRDRYTYGLAISGKVGKEYLVCSKDGADEDLYQYLMEHYKLPLLRDWVGEIRREMEKKFHLTTFQTEVYGDFDRGVGGITVPINGVSVPLSQVRVMQISMTEEGLEEIVSNLLRQKRIWFTKKYIPPLDISGLDDYFMKYGPAAGVNLDKKLDPLVGLKPNVEHLAIKHKSLFPQQAATVEGIAAMHREGLKYAILNHGMGCGKTIEAASACEAIAVEKWLKRHPGKTLKDAYLDEGAISYRCIIMCPGHLVEKWSSEIREEIPFAKTTILDGGLSQLIELREAGKQRRGKEFYIISKDTCKLGTTRAPIPTKVWKKHISLDICSDCMKEDKKEEYKKGVGSDAVCPCCGGKEFEPKALTELPKQMGLLCPHCNELLIQYKSYSPSMEEDKLEASVLTPASFAAESTLNSKCYHCGASLWGDNAKPVVAFGEPKRSAWAKISHRVNATSTTSKTAWVLRTSKRDYTEDYLSSVVSRKELREVEAYGNRKVAPAAYIKKYLSKGFFDFCILDECHKYLGSSAQGHAAHVLAQASAFTMALTGTISNGSAECFFNLFWMLEPSRMKEMGYAFNSGELMRFCKEYGCVETVYEASDKRNSIRNAMSRGRVLVPPKIKPGISPVLLGKMLLDRCLFLDISDLSKYLPPLKEEVALVDLPQDIQWSYNNILATLKDSSRQYGQGILSTMLQLGLSYPDKPYSRGSIYSPYNEEELICKVPSYDNYADPTVLLPKEKKLIEIVSEEVAQNRNVFVYASFTGKAEANLLWRLQEIIEKHCNLKGQVTVIQTTSPEPKKREAWFHKKASEGTRVFVCNPKLVETGLDFCFKHDGCNYNYPTIVFMQMNYELASIWQASRRAYRLSQKEPCRTVYLAYNNTLQAVAVEIMAKKQVATAAIQGKFSAEGLSSMAKGVDMRAQLAAKLAQGDSSTDKESIEGMFDALASQNTAEDDSEYGTNTFVPSLTYYELVGKTVTDDAVALPEAAFDVDVLLSELMSETSDTVPEEQSLASVGMEDFGAEFDALFAGFFGFSLMSQKAEALEPTETNAPVTKRKKKGKMSQSATLLDLFA